MTEERTPSARALRRVAEQRARRKVRRRITYAVAGAVSIVALSVIGSVLWLGAGSGNETVETVPEISGAGESVLVLLVDGDEAVGFGLATAHPTVPDRLVLFPRSLLTVLPGFGSWELYRADEFGDGTLPATTLTNLLGARIDGTVRIPIHAVARLLDGSTIELDEPILERQGQDAVVVVAAGSAERDADRVELILGMKGTDDHLTWLVRQGLVLDLLLDEIAATSGMVDELLASSSGDLTLAKDVLASLAADPEGRITAAQVRPVASLGDSDERYQLPVDEAEALIDQNASYLRLVEGERPRVEILNGTDRVAITPPIAAKLVREGFRVVLTDNADRNDYQVSRIVGHTEQNQAAALAVYEVLGFGEVRLELRQPSGIVDITVIVGDDFS